MRVISPASTPHDDATRANNQWTVAPGDSFWSIASDTLSDATGRSVSDREVVAYWTQVIDANRAMLVVPGDVDLIFPGQVVALPPVTAV
jgi:nucleoid-associated protein YgaU